jgi:hypothetical protein
MTTMQSNGFRQGGKTYDDGQYNSVDWTDTGTLASAIYGYGPVKIGVAAETLQTNPNGFVTPGTNGWAMYNYPPTHPADEDHCISICGYGDLNDLISLFNGHGVSVSPPPGMPTTLCYAVFTWNSIGIIDRQSMQNMTHEAWIRNPVTVIN